MKKNIFLLLMSFSFFMATDAHAYQKCGKDACNVDDIRLYGRILGGSNYLQNTTIDQNRTIYQGGYIVAGSLGVCWDCGVRLEAEYAYRRNDIKKTRYFQQGFSRHGYYLSSSVMGNVLWDLPISAWGIKPFVGAGAGYDFQHMQSTNSQVIFKQNWNNFSWQLMAGLAYPIFCNTEMTVEYIFHQGGKHFNNHSVGLGLVYKLAFLQ